MFVIFSVFYILVAAAMTVLILLQNGQGASAGSGFGGGASATVFGARGSANFLTRATGVLAAVFFALSLGMGVYLNYNGNAHPDAVDLGVMSGVATKPGETPAGKAAVNPEVPQATSPAAGVPEATTAPAANQGEVPAAPPPKPATKP
jgi:preprotein translocase subunit SecG